MAYINKEKTADIRKKLKAAFPSKDGWKLSVVNRDHISVSLTFLAGPHEFKTKDRHYFGEELKGEVVNEEIVNVFHIDSTWEEESAKILKKALDIMMDGNHDNSDIQSDYHDIGWYVDIRVGTWSADYKLFVK